ncbi:MAG: LysR family transcriptional regulator [Betaproteobacteria bacterium]|nr:LysR family transcriptional regulator [Betaproteobacteria bacterium]
MKLDVRDIEYFAVVAKNGHVGRAAEQLGLSQPALSKSLRRLERSLGTKLVKKTPKGVDLTAVGGALLSRVRGLQLTLEDIAREAADLSEGRAGRVRVGADPAVAVAILPEVCSALLASARKVTVSVTLATSTAGILLPALRRGELDAVVSNIQSAALYNGLVREPLCNNEYVVYCSTTHRLARRKSVVLADLVNEGWVGTEGTTLTSPQSLTEIFASHGLPPPRIALTSDSGLLNHRTVAATDLLGFGTKRMLALYPDLRALPVRDHHQIRQVAVSYRPDAYLSPAALRFIEVVKTTARKLFGEAP